MAKRLAVGRYTVRVTIITGILVTLENLFPRNYRYRCRLETRMNSFNYHYRYRLGVRSHAFISIGSLLPSWKSFELIIQNYRYRYRFVIFWIRIREKKGT